APGDGDQGGAATVAQRSAAAPWVPWARPDPADGLLPGSNNFAVSGALTGDGRAIVANDMHLGLRVPNIWFRARLRWPDPAAPGGQVDVQGVTLPGLPAVIVGSNGHVAWGYTNSYGDYADWAVETPCAVSGAARPGATACSPVEIHRERVEVAGSEAVELQVRETAWGPVLHELADGRLLSLRWTEHLPGAARTRRRPPAQPALHRAPARRAGPGPGGHGHRGRPRPGAGAPRPPRAPHPEPGGWRPPWPDRLAPARPASGPRARLRPRRT